MLDAHQASAWAVKLLLPTGARRGEALRAQWRMFDLEATITLLRQMRAESDKEDKRRAAFAMPPQPILFPGEPVIQLRNFWQSVRAKAGVPDACTT